MYGKHGHPARLSLGRSSAKPRFAKERWRSYAASCRGEMPSRLLHATRKARASCPSFLGAFLCKAKVCKRTLALTRGILPRGNCLAACCMLHGKHGLPARLSLRRSYAKPRFAKERWCSYAASCHGGIAGPLAACWTESTGILSRGIHRKIHECRERAMNSGRPPRKRRSASQSCPRMRN